MKAGLKRKPLGSILSILNGYAFDAKAFSFEVGMPLIRIRDLKSGNATQTNFEGPFDKRYVVKAGSFLIGMDGEFGCFEWYGADALLNQRVCKLHSFAAEIDPKFLFYGINKHLKEIEDNTTFTTVKHLSSKQIANIDFAFPPIDEQRRIVAVLDKAFAGIATATANAQKNLTNARALFDSYLQNILTVRGEGWADQPIGSLSETALGKMLDKQKNKGELRPYLRNINVRWFEFDLNNLLKMRFEHNETARYSIKRGDVVICEGGYPGRAAVWATDDSIFYQKALHRVRFKYSGMANWFVYILYHADATGDLKQHFTGSGIQHFTGQALKKFEIPVPPLYQLPGLIADLDMVFLKTNLAIAKYERKLAALTELKQSLLQKAFAGELT